MFQPEHDPFDHAEKGQGQVVQWLLTWSMCGFISGEGQQHRVINSTHCTMPWATIHLKATSTMVIRSAELRSTTGQSVLFQIFLDSIKVPE